MTEIAFITLPFPPSAWVSYRAHGRHKNRTPVYKKYCEDVYYLLKKENFKLPKVQTGEGYSVNIALYRPNWITQKGTINKRAGDVDNFVKPITDAMARYLSTVDEFEDSMMLDLSVRKVHCASEPFVVVSFLGCPLACE